MVIVSVLTRDSSSYSSALTVAQEEKTLYVTVVGARDLPSVDRSLLVSHCDPFFQLKCNGQTSNTSTKHDTREPK